MLSGLAGAAWAVRTVWEHMTLLRATERDVAELCLVEELSVTRAAAVLNRRPATVRTRLNRVCQRLRVALLTGDTGGAGNGHDAYERAARTPIKTVGLS